ncbi:phosphoenolpyruvate--protein phosphotransferase [Tessaracoccus flavus]|uniref:Phosphoenolpyruvate-protein phosphotransferase n=1 Tax=Tessaracoccus flavus TaxID=1610493 RepID=A0A1Q2CCH2_9ACTN|nr:putative PEP-binding protein [Tessaracoccus flavus]AQP43745.1 phosphoenolpyruvate--protein phosphotransferase [Tessaracoccus flavus]SDY22594.1 phosphoenolpyruvate--protein phosphotransferase [Tessaracoccus flavus]
MGRTVSGTGVVAGVVKAPVVWLRTAQISPEPCAPVEQQEREAEAERLREAVEAVALGYEGRGARADGQAAEVLSATAALARDRGWLRPALGQVSAGRPAVAAMASAIDEFVAVFTQIGGVMAERVADLRDIRNRIAARLAGNPEPGLPHPDQPSILLADDLAPADTADLDPELFIAIATRLGGPTGHTAIIARQRGLPCLVGVTDLDEIRDGETVVLDGEAGVIHRDLGNAEATRLLDSDARRRAVTDGWHGPAHTADGVNVELLANVADGDSAVAAAAAPVEGAGLFRTELGFLGAPTEPSVHDQAERYSAVLRAFGSRKVVVRTLDAGTDKPVPFASLPDEPNPALGVRGHRLTRAQPGLLSRQLDAIALASAEGPAPWVMAPMISTVDEAAEFAAQCRSRGLTPGVMVEVPAAALMADRFLEEVDFVSIGTNDLAQYTMAADRLSPELAPLTDPWQPAVLKLVAMTADAGQRAGKPVGVCGEAASDPILACVLVGLGVTSLSMAHLSVPSVGVQLAEVTLAQCRAAAQQALSAPTAAAAREAARAELTR